jgi:hypothetical protein
LSKLPYPGLDVEALGFCVLLSFSIGHVGEIVVYSIVPWMIAGMGAPGLLDPASASGSANHWVDFVKR